VYASTVMAMDGITLNALDVMETVTATLPVIARSQGKNFHHSFTESIQYHLWAAISSVRKRHLRF
jgi:hemolysin-activating ACP:hemolysin acyltransferase